MRLLFFKRLDDLLRLVNYTAIMCDLRNPDTLEAYRGALAQLFRELRPKIFPKKRREIEKLLKASEISIYKWQDYVKKKFKYERVEVREYPLDVKNELHRIQDELQAIIDALNLRFPVVRKFDETRAIKEGVGKS